MKLSGCGVLRHFPTTPVFSDFTDMRVSESELKMQHFSPSLRAVEIVAVVLDSRIERKRSGRGGLCRPVVLP
jgi:hypothetical protein